MRSGVCERLSTGKLVRGIENQLARQKLDCHDVQISDHSTLLTKSSKEVESFGERTDT